MGIGVVACTYSPCTRLTCPASFSGGDWTLMHSDWALASCFLKTAGIGPTEALMNGALCCIQWCCISAPTRHAASLGLVPLQGTSS